MITLGIIFQRDGLQRIDNAFAEEVVVACVTLAGSGGNTEYTSRALSYCCRRRARLIVSRDLEILLHLSGRHVDLVRIVIDSEVTVLADDQRCDASSVRRRHRGALDVAVGVARRRATWAGAL